MVEEHFSGDISAQPVITHPNSVVALSPWWGGGGGIAIPYCREEVQIRDIAPERNLAYFHGETVCMCTVVPVVLILMADATLPVNFSRTLVNSSCA